MSQIGNIHTINLGKVLLSQRQHRAVRAINMIREYTVRHMGATNVKIDEKLAHQVWARGVRRPPRKVTVEFIQDKDVVLVVPYELQPDIPEAPPAKADVGTAALTEPRDDDGAEKAAAPPEEVQPAAGEEDSARAAASPEEVQPSSDEASKK